MSAGVVLARLEGVRRTGEGRWIARCPSHDDRTPSLSIRETGDGRTLIHCFSGCSTADVLDAVGLTWSALYPPRPRDPNARRQFRRVPITTADDALKCLGHEAQVLVLLSGDLARGRTLSESDRERLRLAAVRIEKAASLCT